MEKFRYIKYKMFLGFKCIDLVGICIFKFEVLERGFGNVELVVVNINIIDNK